MSIPIEFLGILTSVSLSKIPKSTVFPSFNFFHLFLKQVTQQLFEHQFSLQVFRGLLLR